MSSSPGPASRQGIGATSVSSHTHAAEFSRTDAGEGGQRKGLCLHARGLRFDGLRKRSYPIRVEGLLVAGTSTASLAGGRWSVPEPDWLSSRRDEACEAPLPGLQHPAD